MYIYYDTELLVSYGRRSKCC